VKGFVNKLRKQHPDIKVFMQDERYTSLEAKQIILQSGANRKKRRDKALVDKVSAALILEDFLNNKQ
jgi:putative holliday junction resolvase